VTAGLWDEEPTVLMEFDIISAEIAALAWESGDEQMIKDVNRNMLGENHPDYLDLHGSTAVEAFKLTCAPTKKGLKSIGKPGLRVAAKNVRFGVPYGRSAEALSRQCRGEGADVSVGECQRLIDNYRTRYPNAWKFLGECEVRPADEEKPYMYGAFGRIRRFQPVDDQGQMAEQGRSAKNYPIQNLVADYILLVMYHLRRERAVRGMDHMFRVVLQIHDALMLEVKVPYIAEVEKLVRHVMTKMVPIMPRTIVDNVPFDKLDENHPRYLPVPYNFEVDCSVFLNWSQAIDPVRGAALGIPKDYLGGKD
jgi:DNA polymerase I-like protein with 3'-5' exonuclease and polymerase domains